MGWPPFPRASGSWVIRGRLPGDGTKQGGQAVECGREFISPGPGRRYPQTQAAAAGGDPGSDVQDSVAQFLGFGGGQIAV